MVSITAVSTNVAVVQLIKDTIPNVIGAVINECFAADQRSDGTGYIRINSRFQLNQNMFLEAEERNGVS